MPLKKNLQEIKANESPVTPYQGGGGQECYGSAGSPKVAKNE